MTTLAGKIRETIVVEKFRFAEQLTQNYAGLSLNLWIKLGATLKDKPKLISLDRMSLTLYRLTASSKISILYGGGIDSTVLTLLMAVVMPHNRLKNIELVYIRYGQKSGKGEIQAVNRLHQLLPTIATRIIDVGEPFRHSKCDLVKTAKLASNTSYNLPLRNLMLVVLSAMSLALDNEKDPKLLLGFHQEPTGSPYRDAYTDWFQPTVELIRSLTDFCSFEIVAPTFELSRQTIYNLGMILAGEEFQKLYWTCYEQSDVRCGRCPHCLQENELHKNWLEMTSKGVE